MFDVWVPYAAAVIVVALVLRGFALDRAEAYQRAQDRKERPAPCSCQR